MRKPKGLIYLSFLSLCIACTQPKNHVVEEDKATLTETKAPVLQNEDLVVPGKKMGKLFIGQDMQEVFEILGKADDGDAAMGKAWTIWNKGISIYSTYKDSTMRSKAAMQIMVNTDNYSTATGLKNNINLKVIQAKLPELKKVATFINKAKKDTLYVYDAEKEGIAFDVRKENEQLITKGMTIHAINESVNNTYLTIHPGWEKVQ